MDAFDVLNQSKISDEQSHFSFCRRSWEGDWGKLFLCWHGNDDTPRWLIATLGADQKIQASEENTLSPKYFESLMSNLKSLGAHDLGSQDSPLVMTDYDDTVEIRFPDGSTNSYRVCGGKHIDRRQDEVIDLVLDLVPNFSVRWERRRKRG